MAESVASGVREHHMSFAWSDGTGESDFNSLLGKRVRLVGLKARPELNGRTGRVYSWHEDKGRAGVVLDDDDDEGTLALRPANLEEVHRAVEPAAPSAAEPAAPPAAAR